MADNGTSKTGTSGAPGTGIAGEVTTQYIIRYIPDAGDKPSTKVFRNIKVSVPSLSTVRVRSRKGYYPANP